MNNKRETAKLLPAILIFLVAAALLAGLWWNFAPRSNSGSKTISVSVTYPDGKTEQHSISTDAEFLKEAAETVFTFEGEESPQGFTLYAINGVMANFQTQKAYWAIYVNGEYGQYAIDRQPVLDGEQYAFVYETF